MKVLPFRIPKTGDPAIITQVDTGPYFYDILHKHPEYQITLIVKGSGTLICDEYLGRFVPGSVLMFGPNQPHVLRCDEDFYRSDSKKEVHAVSLFFHENALGRKFLELEEAKPVHNFLENGKNGFKFSEQAAREAASILKDVATYTGFDLVIEFLKVLRCLMTDQQAEKLSHHQRSMNESQGHRMNAVMQFTLKNFRRNITIQEIAEVASMTPNAFCKYFKARTRKTYLNYLNELRISFACRLLGQGSLSVSQVANQSGFKNLSHFNRCFKRIMHETPGKYGRLMNQ